MLTRLKDIGLLCGTDFTPLFASNFYYSRFDHSVGVALIIWNFTHNKAQTLAGLFHDVSTPAFSHVSDFRKGDALTQTATEEDNTSIIYSDPKLKNLLEQDGVTLKEVENYHLYPVADNEIPGLSADRLEYMFPSGAALAGTGCLTSTWNLSEIRDLYNDIVLCKNENGQCELGFATQEAAAQYTVRFNDIGHLLQTHEDKMVMQLLAHTMELAVNCGVISEDDFYKMSEKQIMDRLKNFSKTKKSLNSPEGELARHFTAYTTMTKVEHTDSPLENCFCENVKVKQRYITPLAVTGEQINGLYQAKRITELNEKARKSVQDFLAYDDTPWGCVTL